MSVTAKATATASSGVGLGGLVFVVLLVLKLTGLAPALTWFWVFFPLWIGPSVVIGFLALLGLAYGLLCLAEWVSRRRRSK